MKSNWQSKISKILLVALFGTTALSGCGTVNVNDAEWCGDMGVHGAYCFHTLSDAEREINVVQWSDERFGMVCTKAENFANWKAAIEKLCNKTKSCDYRTKQDINAFFDRMKKLNTVQMELEKWTPNF